MSNALNFNINCDGDYYDGDEDHDDNHNDDDDDDYCDGAEGKLQWYL